MNKNVLFQLDICYTKLKTLGKIAGRVGAARGRLRSIRLLRV